MNAHEAREMRERLDLQDENIWFMEGYFEEKKRSAEASENKEAAQAYGEIATMIEHIKDDKSLKKIFSQKRCMSNGS